MISVTTKLTSLSGSGKTYKDLLLASKKEEENGIQETKGK